MVLYFRLLSESFRFAINALKNNVLRTLLSLLGVTIGIFSIIAVLAAVESLSRKIGDDLSALDKQTIYLLNESFGPSDIPKWKRDRFPNIKYDEYVHLKNSLTNTAAASFQIFTKDETLRYGATTFNNVTIYPASHEVEDIETLSYDSGRFYTESESISGAPVIVIGKDIATAFFQNDNPIGKKIRLYGQRFTVIGVLKKEGEVLVGVTFDTSAYIPVNFVRQKFGDNNNQLTNVIVLKPNKNVDMDSYKAELSQKLRSYRGIKAGEIDNFFMNVFSGFTDLIDGILGQMNLVGWVISGFSLLVGGFGISNIMFVSVKERTNLIGIQKSLGAKNQFILFQFLFEAIILSVIGGAIGLFLVWMVSLGLNSFMDFEFILSTSNILLGTGLAAFIGLLSGILPAISASKLDPVEAIRTGM